MKDYAIIGKATANDRAYGKVTGKLKYCGDFQSIGMVHIGIKHSQIAHGKIRSINIDKAKELPGVRKIYTWENTPEDLYDRGRVEAWESVPNQERLFQRHIRFWGGTGGRCGRGFGGDGQKGM